MEAAVEGRGEVRPPAGEDVAVALARQEHDWTGEPMVSTDVMAGLVAGNFHHPDGIRALRLGTVHPDAHVRWRAACRQLLERETPSVVSGGHVTGWTKPQGTVRQWSLFNRSGRTGDTSSDFDYANLDRKKLWPGFEEFADIGTLVNLRLNELGPGAELSPHEEHLTRRVGTDRVGLRCRLHVPIWSNPNALMLADGDWFGFSVGGIYLFNNGCVHAAVNHGNTSRLHLVFDVLLDEATVSRVLVGNDVPGWWYHKVSEVEVDRTEEVEQWESQPGMTWQEFSSRTLVLMP